MSRRKLILVPALVITGLLWLQYELFNKTLESASKEFDNLIVTRSFSKAYGLAGLRVGYAIANKDLTNILNRVRQPFNVNLLALTAAEVALSDTDYLDASVKLNHEQMRFVTDSFRSHGVDFIHSIGNFVCIKVDEIGRASCRERVKN